MKEEYIDEMIAELLPDPEPKSKAFSIGKIYKVKIITEIKSWRFEEEINKFIKGKEIIDIKYNCQMNNSSVWYTAMIIYKE